MRYLILIYENEATVPQDPAEFQRWKAAIAALHVEAEAAEHTD